MREQDRVGYVGPDDEELGLWHGQPGRVVDTGLYPAELAVSFVNGPSLCLAPDEVEALDDVTYGLRAQRVLRLTHPVREGVSIPQFWVSREPWPDDDLVHENRM